MPRSAACLVNASLWLWSIIALRPEIPPCRAHVLKNLLQDQFADLGVQGLDVDLAGRRSGLATALKHVGSAFKELLLPRSDLIGMHVELLSKLRNRSIVLQRSQRHLRFEGWCVVPAGSPLHRRS